MMANVMSRCVWVHFALDLETTMLMLAPGFRSKGGEMWTKSNLKKCFIRAHGPQARVRPPPAKEDTTCTLHEK